MVKNVIWSPLAEHDFSQILEYLDENWDSTIADNFIELTFSFIEQITVYPKLFPLILKSENIRRCVITKQNTLFYKEDELDIIILRIFDTRQNPNKLKFPKK